jgi:hypothetical protein
MPVFRSVQDAQAGEVKLEALHQPIYDEQTITSATDYSFFQNPAGRSELLTNVNTAGQLSWPKRFSVKAIRLVLDFDTEVASAVLIYKNTLFRLKVGEKNYLTIPAFMLTPGVGLEVYNTWDLAIARASNPPTVYAHNGRPEHRNIYSLIHAVYIPPVQNFSATLSVTGTVTALPTAGIRSWLFLEGELLREVQ